MIEPGQTHASNSCVTCNKWHRKCDKILPKCTNCASKGKECTYKAPKRKKIDPSESDIRYQPYQKPAVIAIPPPTQQPVVQQQGNPLTANIHEQFAYLEQILSVEPKQIDMTPLMPALEQYFESVYVSSPVVDRSKANLIKTYLRAIRNGTQDMLKEKPEPADIALLYAMRAFFFKRIELHDLAQDCHMKSLQLIRDLFDDVMVNYTIAATFYYISLNLMGVGQLDKAAFYTHGLEGYLKRCETAQPVVGVSAFDQNVQTLRERYLRTLYHIAVYNMSPITDMTRLVKIFLLSHLQSKQYLRLVNDIDQGKSVSSMAGLTNDEALDRFLPLIDMIRHDLDNNKNTFNITWDSIDLMTSKMKDIVNEPLLERGEIELYSKRVGFYLICQGARIQALQRAGHDMDALARRVAEHIALISSGSAFRFCHHNVSGPLALSLLTLLRHGDAANEEHDRLSLLEHATAVLNAMKTLSNKYPIVTMKYGGVIRDAAVIIQERREQVVDKSFSIGDVNVLVPNSVCRSPTELATPYSDIGALLSEFFTEDELKDNTSGRPLETPTNELFFM
jgi:hypothetical protein